ncbi:MAG: hypothetical protein A2749_01985 [Parcubacteria group bacterium RIFCSPHIGHO2_01_FULL_45_26]|nr:MAG: hypothetical protein A2749_01985 [Parcubacteria group bacterium RIFCSPHIGHO2_01_FULL_45_26]
MKIFEPISRFFDKKLVLLTMVCVATAFILFGNSLNGTYTLDDNDVLNNREILRSIKSFPKIFTSTWQPDEPWAGTYRPLTLLSFAINFIFLESTFGLHFVNVLLQALNVFLIYGVVSKFTSKRIACLSALLFMFLPIHVESVASIVGRKELLGLFFVLLSLWWFFDKKYFLSSSAFLLALLANDFSISLLPLTGFLLLIQSGSFARAFKTGFYYIMPLPVYFLLRYLALGRYAFGGGSIDPVMNPLMYVSLKERVFTAFSHLYLYIQKTFYPLTLSPDYSFNQVPIIKNILTSRQAMLGLLFFAGLLLLFVVSRKDFKIILALFMVPYLVMSNIFFATSGTLAERYWYLPSFGLSVLTAFGFDKILGYGQKLKPYAYALGVVILIGYSFLIIKQNRIWLNNRNLFVHAAEKSPNSVWARANLAAVYIEEEQFNEAREEVNAALAIYDKHPPTLNILGKLNWRDKKYQEAEEAFKQAIEFDKNGRNRRSLNRSLAFLNLDLGKNQQAFLYMEEAVKWPSPRSSQRIVKIDEVLYKTVKKYKERRVSSYTKEESAEVTSLIRGVRGF